MSGIGRHDEGSTLDDLISDYVMRPKRPTPRHRRDRHRWTDLRTHATHALTAAHTGLRAAIHGTGTPPGGLALLATLQRHNGQPS